MDWRQLCGISMCIRCIIMYLHELVNDATVFVQILNLRYNSLIKMLVLNDSNNFMRPKEVSFHFAKSCLLYRLSSCGIRFHPVKACRFVHEFTKNCLHTTVCCCLVRVMPSPPRALAILDMLARLVETLWTTKMVPGHWHARDIVNIFKKGDRKDPGKSRGNTLLHVVGIFHTK